MSSGVPHSYWKLCHMNTVLFFIQAPSYKEIGEKPVARTWRWELTALLCGFWMMQGGGDSSKLIRAKVLLVCNFQLDHIRSKRRMLSLISLHAVMSGYIEWFLFLLLYSMTEFQLLNTRISAWPSVLEEWGQHLGEMFVSGVPFLAVFFCSLYSVDINV